MSKDNGGPAFPVVSLSKMDVRGEGMSLRDYFAQGAMQALVADRQHVTGMDQPTKEAQYARGAYRIADAMLAERNK